MKRFLQQLFLILTGLFACSMTMGAQMSLTPEETSFLKSLKGKWSNDSNSNGNNADDFSIMYINGSLKISHPKEITMGGGNSQWNVKREMITACYDKASQTVSFSFKVRIINADDVKRGDTDFWDDIYVHITIPFQDRIEDMMIANYHRKHLHTNILFSEETIYYKI